MMISHMAFQEDAHHVNEHLVMGHLQPLVMKMMMIPENKELKMSPYNSFTSQEQLHFCYVLLH